MGHTLPVRGGVLTYLQNYFRCFYARLKDQNSSCLFIFTSLYEIFGFNPFGKYILLTICMSSNAVLLIILHTTITFLSQ
ncbi:hypothetical protein PRUPE_1G030100 [Prunus persica]|uniref:Uncharacterized protein n=1 Tax=Prunus persica TaxID=3760 RepID=A0A251QRW3_PRUPE|nr:hypothetical protein PRUPE_1G030100 [Prunus persica]